jgi:hypothetical protein
MLILWLKHGQQRIKLSKTATISAFDFQPYSHLTQSTKVFYSTPYPVMLSSILDKIHIL